MASQSRHLLLAAGGTLLYFAGKHLVRMNRRISLSGRTVLITGGSRGLGLLLAREAARRGARVAICARDTEELDRVTDEFVHNGTPFIALPCDVTRRDQVEQRVADVEDALGPIDVLINNAGTITIGPFETMVDDDYREAMDLHFWAPLHAALAVLPSMRERGRGRIVNIASIGGKLPVPHLAPYVASKHALVGLSETMRAELAKDGVFITTVCPGLMRTGSPRNANVKGKYEQEYAWFKLGDSLPGASMDARRAARQILDAAEHGDAEVILSLPAKLAASLHGIAPELVGEIMRLQSAFLPGPPQRWDSGEGVRKRKGKEAESGVMQSVATVLTDRAAEENNQLANG